MRLGAGLVVGDGWGWGALHLGKFPITPLQDRLLGNSHKGPEEWRSAWEAGLACSTPLAGFL